MSHPQAELPAWEGAQSALAPAGVQARRIDALWWQFAAVLSVVMVLTIVATVFAVLRRRRGPVPPPMQLDPGRERRVRAVVAALTGISTVVLVIMLVASVVTGAQLPAEAEHEGARPLEVEIVGHEWWWEIRYPNADPSRSFATANELHIPAGQPVELVLSSSDVIHSFWVPRLHGKRDLIPGYQLRTQIYADEPGIYRGQCAEFCGAQHAHMGLIVVAQTREQFDAWREAQLKASAAPAGVFYARGKTVFMSAGCPMCHTIAGTDAGGRRGPDLTHVASRLTLAAGILPNTRGPLAGWILDPQAIKPGTQMPPTGLQGPDLQALLAYLESLR
jgi:cytochrome c oxidase subunit II